MNNDEYTRRMIRIVNENSLNEHEEEERVNYRNYKREVAKKNLVKARIRKLIMLAIAVPVIIVSSKYVIDHGSRQIELNKTNNYMKIAVNMECPEIDKGVLSDGTVVLFDNNPQTYKKIAEELQSKYGFSRDCAIYCISESYGTDAFDSLVKAYGYDDKDSFLYELYSEPTSISSSGETVYTKSGSYKIFENNVEEEYVDKVKQMQDVVQSKYEKEVGVKYGK